MDKRKALILLTITAVAAIIGGTVLTVYAQDNGEEISETLVEILENNFEFTNIIHEKSDLDLFLARDISNSFNYAFFVFNEPSNGVKFVLKS